MKKHLTGVFVLIAVCWSAAVVNAQTTEFTYQGNLVFNGQPATGQFDFEFRLFPSSISSSQIGSTNSLAGVAVSNGTFTVLLNFGESYDNASRYLEINVRPAGTQSYTMLTPRQRVSSAPSSVNSRLAVNAGLAELAVLASNSNKLGGIDANQYVLTSDTRLSNARPPISGSTYYIHNGTALQTANFAISGLGRANIVQTDTTFNIGTEPVVRILGFGNFFSGVQAGALTTGSWNTFHGYRAGLRHTTGSNNTFIGNSAGAQSVTASRNTIIGSNAGIDLESGGENVIVGFNAAIAMPSGIQNTIVGTGAATASDGMSRNVIVGFEAGRDTASGLNNTLIGSSSNASSGITYGTAIGAGAVVTFSDTIQLGRDTFDSVRIGRLGSNGTTAVCLNAVKGFATCSSSARYKYNINDYRLGADLINKLRPVTFNWTAGNAPDLGLVAEEVAAIDPLLVTYNDKGEIEGVKYDRIGVVLINTIREQKDTIREQGERIEVLERGLHELKLLFCKSSPESSVCTSKEK